VNRGEKLSRPGPLPPGWPGDAAVGAHLGATAFRASPESGAPACEPGREAVAARSAPTWLARRCLRGSAPGRDSLSRQSRIWRASLWTGARSC